MNDDDNKTGPDYRLQTANIPANEADEAPEIYAISDLRALVKPDLDEELGSPEDNPAVCGTEVACSCVPVDSCVCNTVNYHEGGSSCPQECPCEEVCVSLYWYPT